MEKSPLSVPDKAMLLMPIAVVPVFVSVTDFGPPALPTATLYQLRVVGETVPAARQFTPLRRAVESNQARKREILVRGSAREKLK
jgi:hypothetical protein